MLKETNYQPRILYLEKISFKEKKGEKKIFSNRRTFFSRRTAQLEIIQDSLPAKEKLYQMNIRYSGRLDSARNNKYEGKEERSSIVS